MIICNPCIWYDADTWSYDTVYYNLIGGTTLTAGIIPLGHQSCWYLDLSLLSWIKRIQYMLLAYWNKAKKEVTWRKANVTVQGIQSRADRWYREKEGAVLVRRKWWWWKQMDLHLGESVPNSSIADFYQGSSNKSHFSFTPSSLSSHKNEQIKYN